MTATAFSAAVISDSLQAFTRQLDAHATNPGQLHIYSAPRPAAGASAGSATLLAALTFDKPSLQSVSGNTLTLKNPADVLAISTGDAVWGRFLNGAGQYVADADVGGSDSTTAPIKMSTTSVTVYTGGTVSVTLGTYTWGTP